LWHVCPSFRCCGMKDATEINRPAPSYVRAKYEDRDRGTYFVWCQQVTRLRSSRRHIAILQPLSDVSNSNRCWTPLTLTWCFVLCVFRSKSLVQPCLWILHQKLILADRMFKVRTPSTSSSAVELMWSVTHCLCVMKVYSEGSTLTLNRCENVYCVSDTYVVLLQYSQKNVVLSTGKEPRYWIKRQLAGPRTGLHGFGDREFRDPAGIRTLICSARS